jgi:hypothetical protein
VNKGAYSHPSVADIAFLICIQNEPHKSRSVEATRKTYSAGFTKRYKI